MFEFISLLGQLLLRRAPLLLLVLAACIFAIIRWKRHPRVSLMTVVALVILVLEGFVFAFSYRWLPQSIMEWGSTKSGYNLVEIGLNLVDDLIFAGVLLLLVAAAFTDRHRETEIADS